MVLKKPYAFLIKNFRLMHIILTICCIYLITKTSAIISFLGDYIASSDLVIGQSITSGLYSIWMFVIPILMLIFFVILLLVMIAKEKPKTFYIVNIFVYFLILILFIYGRSVLSNMEKEIVKPQTIKTLHDLFVYALIFQIFTSVIAAIRGLGFDIRKFDFAKDLQSLDVSEEDSEEFEVAISYDFSDTKRKFKKRMRNIKYAYLEHKLVFNIIIIAILAFSGYMVYKNTSISIPKYHLNSTFSMNSFSTSFTNAYVVDTDYLGNDLNTNVLVLKVNVKSNNKNAKKFVTSSYELIIDDKVYHHTNKYSDQFKDIGEIYVNQELSLKDYNSYLLVYDIGKKNPKEAKLKVSNLISQSYVYVNFKPKSFTKDNKPTSYELGDEIKFENSNLEETALKINSISIADKIAINYTFCINDEECLDSIEYLRPDRYDTGLDKTIIRMEYEFSSKSLSSFYNLVSMYGSLEYVLDGESKTQTVPFKNIKSNRVNEKNTCNLEVVKEVENASEIYLVLHVRNNEYRYKLK